MDSYVSWARISVAACALLATFMTMWVTSTNARLNTAEDRLSQIIVLQEDVRYLREANERQDKKLDEILAKLDRHLDEHRATRQRAEAATLSHRADRAAQTEAP